MKNTPNCAKAIEIANNKINTDNFELRPIKQAEPQSRRLFRR